MPLQTVETVEKRVRALKEKLAGERDALDPLKLRALRKKVRRAQRKARRLAREAARKAGAEKKKSEGGEDGKSGEAAE
jgi:hypothetical protein